MKTLGVIPARYDSSRLPGKPLKQIHGLPMIVHTMKRACMSSLDSVVVATDSKEIYDTVHRHGGNVAMTSSEHATGTDRVAEVSRRYSRNGYTDETLIVNVQGDEPLLNPEHVDISVKSLSEGYAASCPCAPIAYGQNPGDSSIIKVVRNICGEVMYYSRAPVPSCARSEFSRYLRQVCIYTFRQSTLETFVRLGQSPLETVEKVELLRLIENGFSVISPMVDNYGLSVDTEKDLALVEEIMPSDRYRSRY